jgi:hypothetical protein
LFKFVDNTDAPAGTQLIRADQRYSGQDERAAREQLAAGHRDQAVGADRSY